MTQARSSFCLSKHHHPSAGEADHCNWLAARVQSREIKSYRLYPSLKLKINNKLWLRWQVDFEVTERDGSISYWEQKGWNRSDDSFRLKLRAALLCYPDTKFYVNKRLATVTDCGRLAYYDLNGLKTLRAYR